MESYDSKTGKRIKAIKLIEVKKWKLTTKIYQ
jgi:hypothetical protein